LAGSIFAASGITDISSMALSARAKLLVTLMFAGCLLLWVGVPLGWLWVGSQVQARTDSVGAALGAMMLGMVVTIALLILSLVWLNRLHVELEAERGRDGRGPTALDRVLVASAAVAVLAFAVWFFGWSGSEPLPLNISY
jgi:formate hydrogenlyase subunit 3/multisubunit Na+/H+ antiporter MnhD subunit